MTDYRLRLYPDDILRMKCSEVEEVDPKLMKAMSAIVRKGTGGVGLAAPQAGASVRLIVVLKMFLANPIIVGRSAASHISQEGCLSLPKMGNGKMFMAGIRRSDVVYVKAHRVMGNGKLGVVEEFEFKDRVADIVQHEVDHLDGVLFQDHMHEGDRKRFLQLYGDGKGF